MGGIYIVAVFCGLFSMGWAAFKLLDALFTWSGLKLLAAFAALVVGILLMVWGFTQVIKT